MAVLAALSVPIVRVTGISIAGGTKQRSESKFLRRISSFLNQFPYELSLL